MVSFSRFLTRRWLIAFLGAVALLFGLTMLHPYPRQSLFGPTIRGKPWCVWEAEVRRFIQREEYENTLYAKTLRWMGVKHVHMDDADLFDHAEMLPLLLHLTSDADPVIRRGVLNQFFWFRNLQDKSAAPTLRARLDDLDPHCRIEAALALTNIQPNERPFPVLVRILGDPGNECRFDAMHALTYMVDDSFFDTFVGYAKDADPIIRSEVMFTLHRFGKKALPTLLRGAEDPHLRVRHDAIESLGALGPDPKEAVPVLEQCLSDKEKNVRAAAPDALAAIEPERFEQLKAGAKSP
jgi:HEAT repeat protein